MKSTLNTLVEKVNMCVNRWAFQYRDGNDKK